MRTNFPSFLLQEVALHCCIETDPTHISSHTHRSIILTLNKTHVHICRQLLCVLDQCVRYLGLGTEMVYYSHVGISCF